MVHLFVSVSKYLMIFFMMAYSFICFYVFRFEKSKKDQKHLYHIQRVLFFLLHFDGFMVLFVTSQMNVQILAYYFMQLILFLMLIILTKKLYPTASELVLNNMCLLLGIGFMILCRISFTKSMRQLIFAVCGIFIGLMIPFVLNRLSTFRKLTWIYAGFGILSLLVVAVAGETSYGAKLSLSFAGISIQPSEFVKILFVFFVASMLFQTKDFRQVFITSVVSAVFVLILVASRDLGSALLFFFTFLIILYVATKKWYYLTGGLSFLALASVIGYKLFSHVQTRVLAWQDPLSVIDDQGYQISQSLFAIGTGGWFGLGLNQGMPQKIPVVENDFIFSAISEEMGGAFAICLLLVCISCFFMFLNLSMQMNDPFYRLVALGLGTLYGLQVFLTVGGVTKFIPSTGVTLPLVSNGGSSLLSTLIIFGIIQGLYIYQSDEKKKNTKKKGEKKVERKKH